MRAETTSDLHLLLDQIEATEECLGLGRLAAAGLAVDLEWHELKAGPAILAAQHLRRAENAVRCASAALALLLEDSGTPEPFPGPPGPAEGAHLHREGFACPVVACAHLG